MKIKRSRKTNGSLCGLLAAALVLSSMLLCMGCGSQEEASQEKADEENAALQIVTTIFPIYDWTCEMTEGTDDEVTLLLDNGQDMHSFQPSAADIAGIQSCDVLIYVGGESESWVADVLAQAGEDGPVAINLLDCLGEAVREETTPEGAQEEDEAEDEAAYDEHVWLSLKNAEILTQAICEGLSSAVDDAQKQEQYALNADAYAEQLSALDALYAETIDNAARKTLIFCDRYPFLYLAEDYGLTCYAAFPGCSAETEASFETVKELAQKVQTLAVPCVLVIDDGNDNLANTVLETADASELPVLSLNSMQAVTSADIEAGASYLSIMEENLEVLAQALH